MPTSPFDPSVVIPPLLPEVSALLFPNPPGAVASPPLLPPRSVPHQSITDIQAAVLLSSATAMPTVAIRRPIALAEGGTLSLTSEQIQATDLDTSLDQLVYTLRSAPLNGMLERDGQTIAPFGTFTQTDINQGRITYRHNGSETIGDGFSVTVSDGGMAVYAQIIAAQNRAIYGYFYDLTTSSDGQFEVFASPDASLVSNDTNGVEDIFLRDRTTNTVTRISVDALGNQADGRSLTPVISADGRYIAYGSYATNLVPNDTNQTQDIFLYDRLSAQTTRVSVSSNQTEANGFSGLPALSWDGRYVAFYSMADTLARTDEDRSGRIFLHDRQTQTTTPISVAIETAQTAGALYRPKLLIDDRLIPAPLQLDTQVSSLLDLTPTINGSTTIYVLGPRQVYQRVTLSVTPVNDAPTLANPTIVARQGDQTLITRAMLAAQDPDTAPDRLIYTVVERLRGGSVWRQGRALQVGDTFTQADINAGLLIYRHNRMGSEPDRFTVTLLDRDGRHQLTQTIDITIAARDVRLNADNGHYYEWVSAPGIEFAQASAIAQTRNYYGRQGYLATITADSEQAISRSWGISNFWTADPFGGAVDLGIDPTAYRGYLIEYGAVNSSVGA